MRRAVLCTIGLTALALTAAPRARAQTLEGPLRIHRWWAIAAQRRSSPI
jgi:hypothetical protein